MDSEDDAHLEAYSCSRCRRLKKKCSRHHPNCAHCLRAGKQCVYPGKAPRRTKKELREAMQRGEYVPSKRHKTSSHSSESQSRRQSLDFSAASPLSALPGAPNGADNVSSLISALSSVDNKSGGADSNLPLPVPLPLPLPLRQFNQAGTPRTAETSPSNLDSHSSRTNTTTTTTTATHSPVTQYMMPLGMPVREGVVDPLSGMGVKPEPAETETETQQPRSDGMYFQPRNGTPISSLLNESADPNKRSVIPDVASTPIQAPFFEIETINSVFQGGKKPRDLNANGTYKTLDRNLMDRFIAAYFRHNHRLFPMINKIAFLKHLCKIKEFNFHTLCEDFDDLYVFKLYMILAIGCTTLRRAGMLLNDEEELSEHLAYLAMTKFKAVTCLQNMDTIECHLLLGIYSFFEPKGWSSWTISGIIMRLTIGMGLNRDLPSKKKQVMSATDIEARYRVFWSAYCFERLVATVLGRISAIDDEDITVPLPHPLYEGEREEIDVTNTMISLRRMSGLIYQKVHSVRCGKMNLTNEQKQEIISNIRLQLDEVYDFERKKMEKQNEEHKDDTLNVISFHSSNIWLAMRYAQLQILLYKPSTLVPKPPIESLAILGDFCLKAWKHTYTLYQKKLLPLNWITLFRTLTICNTILYCLCQWAIDLIESKIEIQQIVEILQHFGAKWVFATKCAEVFQGISNCILDISLSDGKVPNMDKLTRELFGANDAYHVILDENNVDISWSDKLAV